VLGKSFKLGITYKKVFSGSVTYSYVSIEEEAFSVVPTLI